MSVTFPIETQAQKQVLGVAIAFSILVVVTVGLRLSAHRIAQRKWRISDYFIIAAGVFAVALQSIVVAGVFQTGIGYGHLTAITETYGQEPIIKLLKLAIPLQCLWALSLSCTKISILFLYNSIFPVTWVVRIVWITIGVIVAWTVGTVLTACFICRPFAYHWDHTIPGGSCGDQTIPFTVTGVVNLITNLIVLVTPIPLLCNLRIVRYKKITLMVIFTLAPGICVVSILRIFMITTMDFADVHYSNPLAMILSGFEICLAVILASIPLMRPLLGRSSYSPEVTVRPSNKWSGRSRGSRCPSDDDLQPLQDDSNQLILQPIGARHEACVTVKKPSGSREPHPRREGSLRNGETPERQLQQNSDWEAISVKQEWAVSRGKQ